MTSRDRVSHMLRFVLLSLLLTLPLSAQQTRRGARPVSYGGVEGDVYMVFMNGDVVPMAGRSVSLLRNSDSLQLDVVRFCERWKESEDGRRRRYDLLWKPIGDSMRALEMETRSANTLERMRASESIIRLGRRSEQVYDSLKRLDVAERGENANDYYRTLLRHRVFTAPTGLQAHFRFERVPLGDYVLYAQAELSRGEITLRPRWWAEVTIVADSVLRRDLDDSVSQGRPFSCPDK